MFFLIKSHQCINMLKYSIGIILDWFISACSCIDLIPIKILNKEESKNQRKCIRCTKWNEQFCFQLYIFETRAHILVRPNNGFTAQKVKCQCYILFFSLCCLNIRYFISNIFHASYFLNKCSWVHSVSMKWTHILFCLTLWKE